VNREDLITHIVGGLSDVHRSHVVRVAVDGVDAAGKTTLAEELANCIRRQGGPVIRAGVDGFHNPRSIRYQRGILSPEGFYRDSFDLSAIVNALLVSLGPGGSGKYRTAVFDHASDTPVGAPLLNAQRGAILLFDGIFLLRNELRRYWDFTIFVKAEFQTTSRACPFCATRGSSGQTSRSKGGTTLDTFQARRCTLTNAFPRPARNLIIDNNDPCSPDSSRESGEIVGCQSTDPLMDEFQRAYGLWLRGDLAELSAMLSLTIICHLPGKHMGVRHAPRNARADDAGEGGRRSTRQVRLNLSFSASLGTTRSRSRCKRFQACHADNSLDQIVCGIWRFESDLCVEVWSHFADQDACDQFWRGVAL